MSHAQRKEVERPSRRGPISFIAARRKAPIPDAASVYERPTRRSIHVGGPQSASYLRPSPAKPPFDSFKGSGESFVLLAQTFNRPCPELRASFVFPCLKRGPLPARRLVPAAIIAVAWDFRAHIDPGQVASEKARRKDSLDLGGVAAELSRARTKAGVSHSELNRRTGISRTVLIGYEKGRTKPGARELRLICDALAVTPNRLIYGMEAPFEADMLRDPFQALGFRGNVFDNLIVAFLFSMLTRDEQKALLVMTQSLLESRHGKADIELAIKEAELVPILTIDVLRQLFPVDMTNPTMTPELDALKTALEAFVKVLGPRLPGLKQRLVVLGLMKDELPDIVPPDVTTAPRKSRRVTPQAANAKSKPK